MNIVQILIIILNKNIDISRTTAFASINTQFAVLDQLVVCPLFLLLYPFPDFPLHQMSCL